MCHPEYLHWMVRSFYGLGVSQLIKTSRLIAISETEFYCHSCTVPMLCYRSQSRLYGCSFYSNGSKIDQPVLLSDNFAQVHRWKWGVGVSGSMWKSCLFSL